MTLRAAHPEAARIAGRALPNSPGPWPAWLSREHWAPLDLLDYGDQPLQVNAGGRLCLNNANAAYREIFDRTGAFSPPVQAVGRHHRRCYQRHGRLSAVMHDEAFEQTRVWTTASLLNCASISSAVPTSCQR